jgi:hypothetical protein
MTRRWAVALLLAGVSLTVYASTLANYPVQDDFGVLALLGDKPADSFPHWFVSTWMDDIWGYTPDEVRPFPAVSYQLTTLTGATHTFANHALNVALHAGNAWLVLLLGVEAVGLTAGAAALGAVVFAVLPIQTETVAWITGRVDSLPALFYLAGVLAWVRWRRAGGAARYGAAFVWLFLALFSKQNTITFVAAIAAVDLLLLGVRPFAGARAFTHAVRAYLPFAVLTAAYLGLRYVLFGAVVREDTLAGQPDGVVTRILTHHVERLVLGSLTAAKAGGWTLAGAGAAVVAAGLWRAPGARGAFAYRAAFSAVWIGLGLLPVVVAGYESPRHAYLASTGWAWCVALSAQMLWRAHPVRVWRGAAAGLMTVVLGIYATQVFADVRLWNTRARVSEVAVRDLDRELAGLPDGTLVLVGAPDRSWEWALPFVARPPYASRDHWARLTVISPRALHCCRAQWEARTRDAVARWASAASRPPVVGLFWDAQTGALSRVDSGQDPSLGPTLLLVVQAGDPLALDQALRDVLRTFVAPRRVH